MSETDDFVDSLKCFVLTSFCSPDEVMYSRRAVHIADARNHLFIWREDSETDEAADVFALRDLCMIDEETMAVVPDVQRMYGIARNYWK